MSEKLYTQCFMSKVIYTVFHVEKLYTQCLMSKVIYTVFHVREVLESESELVFVTM